MNYTQLIPSPLGNILLSADEIGLTGLWFEGEKYYADALPREHIERETPILMDTKRWLDVYFTGREPDFTPPLHPAGCPSGRRSGNCCLKSHTGRRRHTVHWRSG